MLNNNQGQKFAKKTNKPNNNAKKRKEKGNKDA